MLVKGSRRARSSRSPFRCRSRSPRRRHVAPGPARGPQGPADLGRRHGAGLRRVEGGARARGRALRHARGLQRPGTRRDADRRAAGRLRRRARPLSGRDRRQRRPRARGHERRRHDQLPVGADRRRMGDAGEVRAHVRHPPAERLHRAHRGARLDAASRARPRTAQVGLLTATGRAAFPVPEGPGGDRRRRPRERRDVRLRGHGRSRRADWQTLLAGPGDTAYLGIYTPPTTAARRWS